MLGAGVDEEGVAGEAVVGGLRSVEDGDLGVRRRARDEDEVEVCQLPAGWGVQKYDAVAGEVEVVPFRGPGEGPAPLDHLGEAEEIGLSGANGAGDGREERAE